VSSRVYKTKQNKIHHTSNTPHTPQEKDGFKASALTSPPTWFEPLSKRC